MSLLDLASLVLAPTATKEGKVYSAIPDTGDGDMTFSRGSAATRVNSAGLIEKVRTNTFLYSEDFSDATWVKERISVSSNVTTAPDGTSTADKIVENTDNNSHRARQNANSTQGLEYTLSYYLKASERTKARIVAGGLNASADFDLSTGVIIGSPTLCTASITNVGSGWYRCAITYTQTSVTSAAQLHLVATLNAAGDFVYTGDGTSGIFVWGAMLETGVLTEYIPTTSAAVSVGITDDVPRVDYSGGGCPKLLLEPQRTNLVTYSEDLTNAAWTKTGVTISSNATTSPDGTTSADKIIANASGGDKFAFELRTITLSQAFTISAFFKKSEYKLAFVRAGGQTSSPYVIYNLDTEAVVSTSGASSTKIEDYGNGWYRILLTLNSATNTTCAPNVSFIPDSGYTLSGVNIPQYTGDGTSGGFVWGCQLEANGASYATSYIPTYGAAVTRGQDACFKTGISSLIGQTAGTIFLEMLPVGSTNSYTERLIKIYGGGQEIGLQRYANSRLVGYGYLAGPNNEWTFDIADVFTSTTQSVKIAMAYASNDVAIYVNGVQKNTDSSASMFSALSVFTFAEDTAGNLLCPQNVKQAILFPTRLTNTELADLTTL